MGRVFESSKMQKLLLKFKNSKNVAKLLPRDQKAMNIGAIPFVGDSL
jgi:hypothetical protein